VAESGLLRSDSKIIINTNVDLETFNIALDHEKCHQMVFRGWEVPEGLSEEKYCEIVSTWKSGVLK
jgi:hypothetical protein